MLISLTKDKCVMVDTGVPATRVDVPVIDFNIDIHSDVVAATLL